ncbi:hypothetical protein GCM10022223_37990 [Kineosporia mesophila]|uniref:LytR/CpsA/Psr regulator C-terminal domain-containing protein n=1 Tax=Kineosporia mesophila TaxID=566012 RepID=A0ABP6ZRW9_9ACTN|nr:hypothetical protein [Kineosporia mesophila]MCD5349778.1 hypothetical protein [Kineosporia mesophila]
MINRPGPELDAFEKQLLAQLKTVVGTQASAAPSVPVQRRQPRLWYLPVAAAAGALAVTLVAMALRPTPAYAVSGGNGKEVTVKVNRLEGAQALQAALRERGITADITYLPSNKACESGRYSEVDTPGLSLTVSADKFKVTIPAGAVGTQDTFVLSASVTPIDHGVQAIVDFGITQGAIAPCSVVDAS